jgi:hypothetical protein
MFRQHRKHVYRPALFNVQILSKYKRNAILSFLLLCIVAFSVVSSHQGQDMRRPHVSAANSTPYLERLELVTANGGSTDSANGGNQWGNHKTRIVRTPDGNIYTIIQAPGTGSLTKQWQLFKRIGENNWQMINEGAAGREPANLLAGPQNELYVLAWPGGRPVMWTSTDGGATFTSQNVPGNWITTNWPYAGAGISPNGTVYLLQTIGGGDNGTTNPPGDFYWAYYTPGTKQWSNLQDTRYDRRNSYAYVLPTDAGQLDIAATLNGHWSDFGYTQPSVAGGFDYIYKLLREWHTPNVTTTAPAYTNIKEVFQTNGGYVNVFQNDAYKDTQGRVHVLYTYQDASTGATATGTGSYRGYQALFDQNGTLLNNVPLTGMYYVNQAREMQDTTGAYWMMTTGNNHDLEVAQAGASDGTSPGPYTTLSLGGYNPSGPSFLAVPRNGSVLQDFLDGVFPINNGAGWVYFRVRLRPIPSSTPTLAPTATPTSTISTTPTPSNTPTPTIIGASYTIYRDSLASSWYNWSYKSTVNFANTSPVYEGTTSLSVIYRVGYATLYLHTPNPVDSTPDNYLFFVARAAQANQHYAVYLLDVKGNKYASPLPLANYGGNPVVDSWKPYKIPLSALGAVGKPIAGFVIQEWAGKSQRTLYVDTIKLITN